MSFNNPHRRSILFMFSLLISFHSMAGDYTIDVIHNDDYRMTGVGDLTMSGIQVALYNLDDPERLLSVFKKSLSQKSSLEQNKAIIMERFNRMDKKILQQKFIAAYKGASLSMEQGVSRYPAILFNNGQSVIYGVTHLPRAVEIYNEWNKK